MDLKIKLLPGGKMPHKATPGAACYDLYAFRIEKVTPFYYIAHLPFITEFSEEWEAVIRPRSSVCKSGWFIPDPEWIIPNKPGVIDSDYRGFWQIHFRYISSAGVYESKDIEGNIHKEPMLEFPYKPGDRVAQFKMQRVEPIVFEQINFEHVEEFTQTKRGTGGHGSTGK